MLVEWLVFKSSGIFMLQALVDCVMNSLIYLSREVFLFQVSQCPVVLVQTIESIRQKTALSREYLLEQVDHLHNHQVVLMTLLYSSDTLEQVGKQLRVGDAPVSQHLLCIQHGEEDVILEQTTLVLLITDSAGM